MNKRGLLALLLRIVYLCRVFFKKVTKHSPHGDSHARSLFVLLYAIFMEIASFFNKKSYLCTEMSDTREYWTIWGDAEQERNMRLLFNLADALAVPSFRVQSYESRMQSFFVLEKIFKNSSKKCIFLWFSVLISHHKGLPYKKQR